MRDNGTSDWTRGMWRRVALHAALLFALVAGVVVGPRAAPMLSPQDVGTSGDDGSQSRSAARHAASARLVPAQFLGADRFGPRPGPSPAGLAVAVDARPAATGGNSPVFPPGDRLVAVAIHAGWARAPPQA